MTWLGIIPAGPRPSVLSNTVPSASRPSYSTIAPSVALIGSPVPVVRVRIRIPVAVVSPRKLPAPTHASTTAAAISNAIPSQSFNSEPRLSGRRGTWVADIGYPRD